ncbi:MAG: hypothetical protein PUF45_09830 [Lachnospiraceae bacterium]|nr:hypothetical protein [Lachnospiraceae bacterium]
MRQNKIAILIVGPVTIAALIVAWVMDYFNIEFWCNVFMGIFGSGLLTVMVSSINYSTERRKTLEAFWSYGHKVINNLNRYSADDDLDTAIDVFLQIQDYDYQPFDDAYGEICFLFHNKKLRKEITERIYSPIMEIRNIINEKSFHFKLYKKTANGNRRVMTDFVAEIDKLLIERKEHSYPQKNGEMFTVSETNTYKVLELLTEFTDYYYWIMYPWKKKEKERDDHAN